ncbi:APC family permease [Sandaracinus amylolyticus]|nr:amino acid permease [Sandaracinus amylolyticus]
MTHARGRRISARTATMLVIASTIGTGAFTTTGLLLDDLGGAMPVMIVWALGGVLAMCGALAYGELTAAMPENGGEYALLSRIYHPAVGFVSGWISLVVGFSAPMAAAAIAFGAYLEPLVPGVDSKLWAIGLILVFSGVHATGARGGARFQDAITALELGLVALLAIVGLALGEPSRALELGRGSLGGLATSGRLAVGLVWVSFSYTGWNAVAYVAGEVKDPERTLPRALLGGTAVVTCLYVALNAAFLASAPPSVLAGEVDVAQVAARHLLGPEVGVVVGAVVAVGLATTVGAIAITGPRVYEQMGLDHPRLAWLTTSRAGARGPVRASVLQTGIALALAATATFDALLTYIGFTLAISNALTLAGVFVMRAREPAMSRPYRAWGHPWTTAVAIALSVWMTVHTLWQRPIAALVGLATIVIGLLLYVVLSERSDLGGRVTRAA